MPGAGTGAGHRRVSPPEGRAAVRKGPVSSDGVTRNAPPDDSRRERNIRLGEIGKLDQLERKEAR
ncbi:hypothetical protein SSP531S_02340 [Streptomyces spongiicola]|uniref:Uncharacterized protein n=1 Tax=Streptomyces spongiicola TaxID=1690221 RepID=A0A388SSN3_9ACTN|nr:hypothetical protein SSP531S_02340 [Streptomyces spongiicola]